MPQPPTPKNLTSLRDPLSMSVLMDGWMVSKAGRIFKGMMFCSKVPAVWVYLAWAASLSSVKWPNELGLFGSGLVWTLQCQHTKLWFLFFNILMLLIWILFHLDLTKSMYNWAIPDVHWKVTKLWLSIYLSRSVMTVYRKNVVQGYRDLIYNLRTKVCLRIRGC